MFPRELPLLLLALLIACGSATLLTLFPATVQTWSRGALDRRPWLRVLTPDCDLAALTDARSAWLLRVYGLALVPVGALVARSVVSAVTAP